MACGKAHEVKRMLLSLIAGPGLLGAAAGQLTPAQADAPAPVPSVGTRVVAPITGRDLYAYHCAECHGEGPGHPGTSALQLKYEGDPPALLTRRKDLDVDAIRLFVRSGVNAMPYFRKTEISDAEVDRIAAYIVQSAHGKAK